MVTRERQTDRRTSCRTVGRAEEAADVWARHQEELRRRCRHRHRAVVRRSGAPTTPSSVTTGSTDRWPAAVLARHLGGDRHRFRRPRVYSPTGCRWSSAVTVGRDRLWGRPRRCRATDGPCSADGGRPRQVRGLPFGVEEAKLYGVLATLVRAAGRNPRPRRLDLQIAATAASARLSLLTMNPDDFVGIAGAGRRRADPPRRLTPPRAPRSHPARAAPRARTAETARSGLRHAVVPWRRGEACYGRRRRSGSGW